MSDRIHKKVADILGMKIPDDTDDGDDMVPMPDHNDIVVVENLEVPDIRQELVRLEHGQRQREILFENGFNAVQRLFNEMALLPINHRARAVEAAGELFKAIADLNKHKIDSQIKIAELRLKCAAFTKKNSTSPPITGNTIIFNREELIRQFGEPKSETDDEGDPV